METEFVYLGHENTIDLILKADGTAVDLAAVTKITLTFGDSLISSENGAADPIRWIQEGYATGEIRLLLGDQAIKPALYQAPLVVYDPSHLNGIFWERIPIMVVSEVEGA